MKSEKKNKLGKMVLIGLFLSFVWGCTSISKQKQKGEWGRLKSFNDLLKKNKPCDYKIEMGEVSGSPLVMAIHGGKIERGTGELARAIGEYKKSSFYIFTGKKAPDYFYKTAQSGHLHITSHRFNDPKLMELAGRSPFCLSLHGYPSSQVDICIGGNGSLKIKKRLLMELEKNYPEFTSCISCCPPYLGKHPKNVVNLCKQQGIQLELSPRLRKKIISSSLFKKDLAQFLGTFFL